MKKKSMPRSKRVIGKILNLRSWTDWDRMKAFTLYLLNGVQQFFIPRTTVDTESFEDAKKRLNLTDEDILVREKGLLRVSVLMVFFAFLLFVYAIYHFIYLQFLGGMLSLVVMFVALVMSFRYHFWYFQMKEKKLGCSIHEWLRYIMGDKR